jgi:hypothetical protein
MCLAVLSFASGSNRNDSLTGYRCRLFRVSGNLSTFYSYIGSDSRASFRRFCCYHCRIGCDRCFNRNFRCSLLYFCCLHSFGGCNTCRFCGR